MLPVLAKVNPILLQPGSKAMTHGDGKDRIMTSTMGAISKVQHGGANGRDRGLEGRRDVEVGMLRIGLGTRHMGV